MPSFNPFGTANTKSTITVLTTGLRDLGHDLPDTLAAKIANADAASRVPDRLNPDTTKAARLWFDAYAEGKDPALDPEILELLTRSNEAVRGLEIHLQELAEQVKGEAVSEAAEEIVTVLQGVVAEAQEHIDEARTRIGPVITEGRASGLSPDNARQYARAKEAFARVGIARKLWVALANFTHRATWRPGRVEELLILADLNLDALDQISQRVHHARSRGGVTSAALYQYDARTLTEFGHRLDLADFDGFRERQDRIAEETKSRGDASQQRPKVTDGIDASRLREARA